MEPILRGCGRDWFRAVEDLQLKLAQELISLLAPPNEVNDPSYTEKGSSGSAEAQLRGQHLEIQRQRVVVERGLKYSTRLLSRA